MNYIVISSFENVDTGDLQSQGDAIAGFPSEPLAQAHFASRVEALTAAVSDARANDDAATFITWIVMLRMPLDVASVEEALEDLELVLEETESIDDPFGELVIAYEGRRYQTHGAMDYPQKDALEALEAWLT